MKKRITLIVFSVLIMVALYVLYCFNYIPHKKYTNADFNIEAYKSNIDKDNDGIDDQTDILNNANNYIKTNPKYKSKYYNTGYPNDEYGVCTDLTREIEKVYVLLSIMQIHIKYIMKRIYWNIVMIS